MGGFFTNNHSTKKGGSGYMEYDSHYFHNFFTTVVKTCNKSCCACRSKPHSS